MKTILFLMLAGAAFAGDKPTPLQEVDAVKLENWQLQNQIADLQGQIIQLSKQLIAIKNAQLQSDICTRSGRKPEDCQIDMKKLEVSRKKK